MSSEEELSKHIDEIIDNVLDEIIDNTLDEIINSDEPDAILIKYKVMDPILERLGNETVLIVGVKAILPEEGCEAHNLLYAIKNAATDSIAKVIKAGKVQYCGDEDI